MKFPKKLIAFGLSLCMSVVPCGPVAAEDFTDAQTDMTDTIDTFTDDGNSEESENTVNTDQITEENTDGWHPGRSHEARDRFLPALSEH